MSPITYEATVKNGCIQLPANVSLPEDAKVYVVVPGSDAVPTLRSPRLVDPQRAPDFQKQLMTGNSDAGV
jgi:hypothetical protein